MKILKLMYKLNQKQLLEKNFWDSFKPALKQGIQLGKSVAKVVAPEIYNPIKATKDWFKQTKTDVKRAGMTKDQIALEYIMEDGFYPLDTPPKINWGSKNTDGTITGNIKVGELEIDPNTNQPKLGRKFSPDKSNYILRYNTGDSSIKVIRRPERHLATSHEEIRDALEANGYDVISKITINQTLGDNSIIARAKVKDKNDRNRVKLINFKYLPDGSINIL
jgi:hypothetical protein